MKKKKTTEKRGKHDAEAVHRKPDEAHPVGCEASLRSIRALRVPTVPCLPAAARQHAVMFNAFSGSGDTGAAR